MRSLAAPKAFAVHSPFGPLVEPPIQPPEAYPGGDRTDDVSPNTDDEDEADKEYRVCVEQIERELASLAGLTGKKLVEHTGRADGVGYKWTHASTEQPTGSSKTTSTSRAWRRTAKWLRDLERCKCPTRADAIRWHILYFTHDAPPPWCCR